MVATLLLKAGTFFNGYPHDYLNTLTAKAFPSFPNPRLKSRGNMLPHSSEWGLLNKEFWL
jgi:hypothetical protein